MDCCSVSYHELSFCHEQNEKKRCPYCSGLRTKKKGYSYSLIRTERGKVKRKIQRYYCLECKRSFCSNTGRRIHASSLLKLNAVLKYVSRKNSLREIAEDYQISASTLYNWINDTGNNLSPFHSMNPEYWSGYIGIDGKEIRVNGRKHSVLIATDCYTGYPFHYSIGRYENSEHASLFIHALKQRYPSIIRGITSDFGKGKCFVAVIDELLPHIPHQICLVHYQRYVDLFIPKTKRSLYYWRNSVLKAWIKRAITAESRGESIYWLTLISTHQKFFRAQYHKRFIRSIIRNYQRLTTYYDYPEIPQTTNVSENINRQMNRKLKNLDGFQSEISMQNIIKIWFLCYQFKQLNLKRKMWSKLIFNAINRPN